MKYILINQDYFERFDFPLKKAGFIPCPLPPDQRLNNMVSAHGDTLIFADEELIINEEYEKLLPRYLSRCFTTVKDTPMGVYPQDTVFNALRIGGCIFAGKCVSESIIAYAKARGLKLIYVKQGYARCSTLPLREKNAAITQDCGMAAAMRDAGITVLNIRAGNIFLKGADYGFIGGASFVFPEGKSAYFFGNVDSHPDGDKIVEFLGRFGYKAVSLGGELTDIGGGIIVGQDGEGHGRRL